MEKIHRLYLAPNPSRQPSHKPYYKPLPTKKAPYLDLKSTKTIKIDFGGRRGPPISTKNLDDFKAPAPEESSMAEFYDFYKNLLANDQSTCGLEIPTLETLQTYFERAGIFHGFQDRLHWPEPQKVHPRLDEFHRFGKLPAELRIVIWEAALPDPRIVIMSVEDINIVNSVGLYANGNETYSSLFYACKESRQVLLANYFRPQVVRSRLSSSFDWEPSEKSVSLAPSTAYKMLWENCGHTPPSFSRSLDCRRDTLLISGDVLQNMDSLGYTAVKIDFSRVKNLAIWLSTDEPDHLESLCSIAASVFPSVDVLQMVISPDDFLHIKPLHEAMREHTIRLIEVNQNLLNQHHTSHRRGTMVTELYNSAGTIRRHLKHIADTNKTNWKSLQHKVAIEGTDVNHECWCMEEVEFPPPVMKGEEDPIYLYTYRPISIASERQIAFDLDNESDSWDRRFALYECGKDGALLSQYDGLEELFRERLKIEDDNTDASETGTCEQY